MLFRSTDNGQFARFELAFAAILGIAVVSTSSFAEVREWKFAIEAEFVEANGDFVTLKTKRGATLIVPTAELSSADAAYLSAKAGAAGDKTEEKANTVSNSKSDSMAEEATKKHEVKIRFASTRFFNALKKSDEERDEDVREVVSSGAREKLDGSGSEIKNLPKPDRSAKAAVRSVKVVGDRAEAVVRLRFKGKSITPTLMLRMEGDDWLAYGITGPNEEDETETILFEDESEELEQGPLGEADAASEETDAVTAGELR